jgi:uncharacterized protein
MANRPNPKRRVVVDTNVLLSGIVWPRWPYEILRYARQHEIELVLCPFIIEQVYRNVQKYFPDSLPYLGEVLALCDYTEVPDPSPEEVAAHKGLMRDPTDIPTALAAIKAQVDCLITTDKDFTDRTAENEPLHQQLRILLPGTFLREDVTTPSRKRDSFSGYA